MICILIAKARARLMAQPRFSFLLCFPRDFRLWLYVQGRDQVVKHLFVSSDVWDWFNQFRIGNIDELALVCVDLLIPYLPSLLLQSVARSKA